MAINFDPTNWDDLLKLMDEHKDSMSMLSGKTSDGERCYVSVYYDRIVTEVYQNNNMLRVNTYHRDGTAEEQYRKHTPLWSSTQENPLD